MFEAKRPIKRYLQNLQKRKSLYSGINLLLAHPAQQVYYLSYPHPSLKNQWVVYKANPEMHTR
jgi:uncharacterized protein with NRDE domain